MVWELATAGIQQDTAIPLVPRINPPKTKVDTKSAMNTRSLRRPLSAESIGQPHPAMVALMGATGSGKTTFINLVSGGKLVVGRTLHSCTNTVDFSPSFTLGGQEVILVDTPGFDDSTMSETDILNLLAVFLAETYKKEQKLAGIIYLHRITDVRMGGISARNFKIFQKLCGEDTLKNVVIVTNRWEEVLEEKGEARQRELSTKDIFFKPALDRGARIVRHLNTRESAHAILQNLLNNNTPLPLLIQKEMVDEDKRLLDTSAGEELNRELKETMQKHQRELERLGKEMKDMIKNKDDEARKELQDVADSLRRELSVAEQNAQTLSSNYDELKARYHMLLKDTTEATDKKVEELQNQIGDTRLQEAENARLQAQLQHESDRQKQFEDQKRKKRRLIERCVIM
ncbi:hypothetical protein V5O48_008507 [Marasmius crinis-equi]|uniref:G domain-containing protein n=1 Tax=Marasmius crinis-equi TaxID=585013 RepID=A0ABR3FDQ5_9AGAR